MSLGDGNHDFLQGKPRVICMPITQAAGHLWYCAINAGFLIKVLCLQRRAQYVDWGLDFFPFGHYLKTSYDIISLRNFVGIVWKISSIPSL